MGKEMYGQSCFDSREENVSKKIELEKNPNGTEIKVYQQRERESMEDMFRFLETKRIHVFSSVTVRMLRRR